jgi:hypothetical protein
MTKTAKICLFCILFLGSLSWSVTMIKSGLITSWGTGYWGANGHDGIWHLALIESIKQGIPPENPLAAGGRLINYHWGFDLLVALLSKITTLSGSVLYFQILPPLFALAIGILAFELVYDWTKSRPAALWAVFFTYFGGSFGWVVTLLRGQGIGGESMFWASQAVSTLINPPYALSLILLLVGLLWLLRYPKPNRRMFLLQVVIFGSLVFMKSYAGILGLVALLVIGVRQWLTERTGIGLVRWIVASAISGIFILYSAPGGTSLLVVNPLWFPRTMLESPDRLGILRWARAWQVYQQTGNFVRFIPLEMLTIAVFLVGNLGMRVIGIIGVLKEEMKPPFSIAFLGMLATAVIIPLVVIQKGTPWNTIQFFYYAQVFLGLSAGIVMARVTASAKVRLPLSLLVIILTVPTTLSTLYDNYLPGRPPATLPAAEQQALAFLKTQPPGTVVSFPYQLYSPTAVNIPPPRPLAVYESTAYVSAYSGHPSFLADTVNLEILGFAWTDRLKTAEAFFTANDWFLPNRFLRDNHIAYIYTLSGQPIPGSEGNLGVSKIYDHAGVRIYRVR